MYLNDIEDTFKQNGADGFNINDFKLVLLLYAEDIVLFAESAESLQNSLNILEGYYDRWKLTVSSTKTKVIIFRKGRRLPQNVRFTYKKEEIEIVNTFKYLGVLFSAGSSYVEHDKMLAGQSLKAIFKMNKYLYKFTDLSPRHIFSLFDKLITPILNYGSEVTGFHKDVERTHLRFCKRLLGVKSSTQNSFIYFELGRTSLQCLRFYNIIKYWLNHVIVLM